MKQITLLLIVTFSWCLTYGQDDPNSINQSTEQKSVKNENINSDSSAIISLQNDVRAMPDYDVMQIIRTNIRYPEAALKNRIRGRVIVTFVVERDGRITNIRIDSPPLGYGLEEEAIRVIKLLPKFKPAMKDGEFVRSYFKFPINFKIPE